MAAMTTKFHAYSGVAGWRYVCELIVVSVLITRHIQAYMNKAVFEI